MASTIIAGNTTNSGTAISSDNTGALEIKTGSGAGTTALTIDSSQNVTAANNLVATGFTSPSTFGYKNKLQNGGMVIDQRNNGGASNALTYTVDRFSYTASQAGKIVWQQRLNALTPPSGFNSYIGFSSQSAYSVLAGDYFGMLTCIEGFNFYDLNWGATAAAAGYTASPITLSFWVRSTGLASYPATFSGSLRNEANNRSYPFTYTINTNTWEYKTITIPGETTGTWATTNGLGVQVLWSLGAGSVYSGPANVWANTNYTAATGTTSLVGTSAATLNITGTQLEKGSTATSYDFRDFSTELMLCQRYYNQSENTNWCVSSAGGYASFSFPVSMRTSPNMFVSASAGVNTYYANGTRGFYVQSTALNAFGYTASAEF
jgi:hypothetical protein